MRVGPILLALVVAVSACKPSVSKINARPEQYYQHKLTVRARIARMQELPGAMLLEVVDERGALLGTVASVMETGAETRVLVVQGPRGETLLPFAEEFVRSVDLVHGVLAVVRPEYLDAD